MTKKRALRRSPREAVAYHEAGHAVIANYLEVPFSRASIEEREGHSLGRVDVKPDWRRRDWVEPYCVAALAGSFAQRRYNPRSQWRYGGNGAGAGDRFMMKGADFQIVTRLVDDMHGDVGGGKVARACYGYIEARAEALVDHCWADIAAVARALLQRGTMSCDEVRQTTFERRMRPALKERHRNDRRKYSTS